VRVLIVDDEPPARRELRRLLAAHSGIEIVGEASSAREANELVRAATPDLVLLDVHLGDGSGFDLLPAVPENTAIVFVTAFDRYAVRAFELNALDYLLKPVEPERLALALRRAREHAAESRGIEPHPRSLETTDWVFIRAGERAEFVAVSTITHITAEGDYSMLHTADGVSRLAPSSLHLWERRLPASDFLRIHRSAIVSLRFVARVEPWTNQGFRVHVRGAREPLTMSRRYAGRMKARIG